MSIRVRPFGLTADSEHIKGRAHEPKSSFYRNMRRQRGWSTPWQKLQAL